MALIGKEDAVIRARLLVHNAIQQANAEWEAGAWVKDWLAAEKRQKLIAEQAHDPLKALDQGRFGHLYSMDLNLCHWIDEQRPDGMTDAMQNIDSAVAHTPTRNRVSGEVSTFYEGLESVAKGGPEVDAKFWSN